MKKNVLLIVLLVLFTAYCAREAVYINPVQDGDIVFKSNSGGSELDVMTMDGASGVVTVHQKLDSPGMVQVGSAMMVFSNLTGSPWQPPADCSTVKDGFVLAGDSSGACTVPVSCTDCIVTGVLPRLNNDVFIKGGTTASSTVSGGTATLIEANLPPHAHSMQHDHADEFATSTHRHNFAHTHQWGYYEYIAASAARLYSLSSSSISSTSISTSGYLFIDNKAGGTPAATVAGFYSGHGASSNLYTTGVLSPPNGAGGSDAITSNVSSGMGGIANFTGNTNNGSGSSTAININPKAVTAIYVIRVK